MPYYLKAFDKNGDGKLSKAEIMEGCKKINASLTDEEVEQLIKEYDFTGDGMVRSSNLHIHLTNL